MINLTEQALVEAVKQGLDRSVSGMDSEIRQRLSQARLQAVDRPDRLSDFIGLMSLSNGFAATAVATLAMILWVLPITTDSLTTETVPVASIVPEHSLPEASVGNLDGRVMDVLMSNEEMDFLENLDMYEWMEAEYG
jgi:hypothetical protein